MSTVDRRASVTSAIWAACSDETLRRGGVMPSSRTPALACCSNVCKDRRCSRFKEASSLMPFTLPKAWHAQLPMISTSDAVRIGHFDARRLNRMPEILQLLASPVHRFGGRPTDGPAPAPAGELVDQIQ